MDAPVPLILAALLAALALAAPAPRGRAAGMLGALLLAPVILGFHVADSDQVRPLRDSPALLAAALALALAATVALAAIFARRPTWLPVAAVFTLPFRVPIASGGSTANLLVPLYLVVAAGVLAVTVPALAGREPPVPERRPGVVEGALAALVALYGVQSAYSDDFGHALENVVFFYVPFALLFVLVARVQWTPRLARACLAVLVGLALVLGGIGFVEYATRHLFFNPKVIASNQLEDYFRVNSLFFDPNVYGRFLAIVMLLVTAWLLWAREKREVVGGAILLLVLWAALVVTFSQSSFASLLAGLAVLGALRWNARRAIALSAAALVVGIAVVAFAPGLVKVDLGSSKSAQKSTSGRYDLISGGVGLWRDAPVFGQGSGSFPRSYRRAEKVSAERATSASHTTPITIAAEQGALGLIAYLALLAAVLARLGHNARYGPERAAVLAAFVALVAHTMMYAAFLEDPLMWVLLGAGSAMAGWSTSRVRDGHRA
ncbi:MAG: O-antigen ligase family protein, partial [Actinomycetota bacterium]|nr:O-antigen ligase family protein [Actinomycetota bacterium]